jgi:hypothetical protein
MKVINLFAGPGTGKSTTAAGLFYLMKSEGRNVELVTEFAKDLVWEEHHSMFADQLFILAQQNRKLERLRDKVDFAITDSPLLIGLAYTKIDYYYHFGEILLDVFNSYNNLNILLKREKPYKTIGRNQDENGAKALDIKIKGILDFNRSPYREVRGNTEAPQKILELIKSGV